MNKLVFKLFYCGGHFALFFLIAIVFLAGCTPKITGSATRQIPAETNKNSEVYFCPKDDCGKALEVHVKSANFSAYCAFYDIDLKNVINALAGKSKSIDVKLVMDSSNYQGQVKGDGIKLDNNEQLMHNKFCVIDEGIVITGSFNPTYNDNYNNKNNMMVVYSASMAENYGEEFEELWDGSFGMGSSVKKPVFYVNKIRMENYFCPEDSCASQIIDLIENAKTSVYFMSFSFTNEKIADALIKKNDLDVKGVVDSGQASGQFSQFKRLQQFGVNVIKDSGKYKMHHKVFIIDNSTVATGSFNPTMSGDMRNDENLLIIHDRKIVKKFLQEFDSLRSQ